MNRPFHRVADGVLRHAEHVSASWASRLGGSDIIIDENDLHCLRTIALNHEDETVSHLLLRKLRVARVVHPSRVPLDVVVMNRVVDFSFAGRRVIAALVHPRAREANNRLSVGSLVGAGLIGLSAGQGISWPDEEGSRRELAVHSVEYRPVRPDSIQCQGAIS